jgi:hypothetical protein
MTVSLYRRLILVAGLSLAGSTLFASEPDAPLQETTRELQALKSSKSSVEVSQGQPTADVPQLLIAQPGSPPPAKPMTAQRAEKDLSTTKSRAQNWLVDGVAELEKKDQPMSAAKRESEQLEALMPSDRNKATKEGEPASLLKLYDEQEEKKEAKRELAEAEKPMDNPLAPFLQNWMSDSPVRGQFFDQFSRGNASIETPRGGDVPGGAPPPVSEFTSGALAPNGSVGAKQSEGPTNPYLAGFDSTGGYRQPAEAALKQSMPEFNPGGFSGAGGPAATPATAPLVEAPDTRKKAPRPSLADEQKYFPQLKKF